MWRVLRRRRSVAYTCLMSFVDFHFLISTFSIFPVEPRRRQRNNNFNKLKIVQIQNEIFRCLLMHGENDSVSYRSIFRDEMRLVSFCRASNGTKLTEKWNSISEDGNSSFWKSIRAITVSNGMTKFWIGTDMPLMSNHYNLLITTTNAWISSDAYLLYKGVNIVRRRLVRIRMRNKEDAAEKYSSPMGRMSVWVFNYYCFVVDAVFVVWRTRHDLFVSRGVRHGQTNWYELLGKLARRGIILFMLCVEIERGESHWTTCWYLFSLVAYSNVRCTHRHKAATSGHMSFRVRVTATFQCVSIFAPLVGPSSNYTAYAEASKLPKLKSMAWMNEIQFHWKRSLTHHTVRFTSF